MSATAEARPTPRRVLSIDAFRGFVMTLMLAEVMRLPSLPRALPDSWIAGVLAFHQSHVVWAWGSLHDMIQPGFSFLVGAALPYSIAARQAKGQSFRVMCGHALWRAILLCALGIFLRSDGRPMTNFTFEDTLTQIGLGYVVLFLLGFVSVKKQIAALAVILIGYWAAFALYPAPGADFDYTKVGVKQNWEHHYTGFMSHWNKNSNLAWHFDTWFMNLFPRVRPFEYNGGGYSTLSFIPTLGTMILGLLTGGWLKSERSPMEKLRGMAVAGAALIAAGALLHGAGICPVVKRIWTPAFTLWSGGIVILILAAFYALMEMKGWVKWAFPLMVVGMNSIAAYFMAHTMEGYILSAFKTHLGTGFFSIFGEPLVPVMMGAGVLVVFWLILYWMSKNRILIRI
jgi:predicted acyltransferase